jgi:hypothetical protein
VVLKADEGGLVEFEEPRIYDLFLLDLERRPDELLRIGDCAADAVRLRDPEAFHHVRLSLLESFILGNRKSVL